MAANDTGDSAFTQLYRATLHPLRRYLTRLLGNDAEAQDVAHDAYMRVYPKIEDASAKQPKCASIMCWVRLFRDTPMTRQGPRSKHTAIGAVAPIPSRLRSGSDRAHN